MPNAPNAARLLTFFAISDIHITDKESPAQPIYPGWSALFGPSSRRLDAGSYSPIILSTTHVLDAAVRTINALHKKSPFDFGISLGDDCNNTQYNELRWFIDVLDGKVITPSSALMPEPTPSIIRNLTRPPGSTRRSPGIRPSATTISTGRASATRMQNFSGPTSAATILDINGNILTDPNYINETGVYMGVVDGSTPYGNVIGAGPEKNFPVPPTVVADPDRRSLVTSDSTSRNWMREFFTTTSNPVGHGFTQANLDEDFACYSFEPKSDLPIKVIVLDDTNKPDDKLGGPFYCGTGSLDRRRLDWLKSELQKGQDEGKLMIIAAHIPIKPQASLTDTTLIHGFYNKAAEDELLATLHSYPNLILWMAGHRHVNVVTAQPNNPSDFKDHPERSFWEVETASLRDFPQQLRTFEIRRNSDNTISIITTDVDPAVMAGSPAAKSRGYAIGVARIFAATPATLADTTSQAYNAELVKQLTPEMQAKIAQCGSPIGSPGS